MLAACIYVTLSYVTVFLVGSKIFANHIHKLNDEHQVFCMKWTYRFEKDEWFSKLSANKERAVHLLICSVIFSPITLVASVFFGLIVLLKKLHKFLVSKADAYANFVNSSTLIKLELEKMRKEIDELRLKQP